MQPSAAVETFPIFEREDAPTNVRLALTIVTAALGYFVDVYDMMLFTIYRVPSLRELGVPEAEQLAAGATLFNIQVTGMVLGGVLWGMLGDKRGRTSVLFGSILFYSLANIGSGLVHNVGQYGVLRFIAGVGFAGEVGAAMTLISEGMSRYNRGYGGMIVYGMMPLGATAAAVVGKLVTWRTGYFIGGAMGLVLLLLRAGVFESRLYTSLLGRKCARGDLRLLFANGRWKIYAAVILLGVPKVTSGFLTAFMPELSKATGMVGELSIHDTVFLVQSGVFIGSVLACLMVQKLRSRKKVIAAALVLGIVSRAFLLNSHGLSSFAYGALTMVSGISTGYGAVFLTMAAELFGTNVRATVATSVPNVVRAAMVGMNMTLLALAPALGSAHTAFLIVAVTGGVALLALMPLEETFAKDLNYVET